MTSCYFGNLNNIKPYNHVFLTVIITVNLLNAFEVYLRIVILLETIITILHTKMTFEVPNDVIM